MRHLALALMLAGCAVPVQRPTFHVHAPFDQAEAERLLRPGVNTIRGNAFMRQQGGGVVTCAGSPVFLTPGTAYATERLRILYATNTERGSLPLNPEPTWVPDPPSYRSTGREAICDAQGNFTFERVADGTFYVTTTVLWQVGPRRQGGFLMHRVSVKDGEMRSLVLSP